MFEILIHNIKVRIRKWWKRYTKVDKLSFIVLATLITYFIICWINVITHNTTVGYTYPIWNIFHILFR